MAWQAMVSHRAASSVLLPSASGKELAVGGSSVGSNPTCPKRDSLESSHLSRSAAQMNQAADLLDRSARVQEKALPRRTLYLVDVHPLCYEGKRPRPTAFLHWMGLLFDQVSLADPVIAVMDGERGNDYRKALFPGYKQKRNKYKPLDGIRGPYFKGDEMDLRTAFPLVKECLLECNVPVLREDDAEADDVIATLVQQAVSKGMKAVVASPDMDYRQLLSQNVNMVLPVPKLRRWSFYTLQQYVSEHDRHPSADLGLRCLLGDQSDNVPGLQDWAPEFGRKTALKLMKKHGSLEKLLLASGTRTVGRPYIQEALSLHRDSLYRNLQLLSLRRDVDIRLKDDWCMARDRSTEAQAFRRLERFLQSRVRL